MAATHPLRRPGLEVPTFSTTRPSIEVWPKAKFTVACGIAAGNTGHQLTPVWLKAKLTVGT